MGLEYLNEYVMPIYYIGSIIRVQGTSIPGLFIHCGPATVQIHSVIFTPVFDLSQSHKIFRERQKPSPMCIFKEISVVNITKNKKLCTQLLKTVYLCVLFVCSYF